MNFTYANTKFMEDVGNEIVNLANEYNILITKLFKRLTSIPFETQEWTGNKALKYSDVVSLDKQQYLDFCDLLKDFGNTIIKTANNTEICVQNSQDDVDYKVI